MLAFRFYTLFETSEMNSRVHLVACFACTLALGHSNVAISEEELCIKIRHLYLIIVSNCNLSAMFFSPHSY